MSATVGGRLRQELARARAFSETAVSSERANDAGFVEMLVGTGVVPLIAWLDWHTGDRLSLVVFYVVPIGWAAYRVSRAYALALALAAVALCLSVDLATARYAHIAGLVAWRTADRALLDLLVALTVARLRRQHDLLREAARTDPLTGLFNRRAFEELAGRELRLARREGRAAALALVDVDRFKDINDTRGHGEGDEVLRAVAAVLRALRDTDVVARLGGDEFAVYFPECDLDAVSSAMERVRLALRERAAARGWPITLSVGVAACRDGSASLEELRSLADASLYEVKRAGRDGVRVAHLSYAPIDPPPRG